MSPRVFVIAVIAGALACNGGKRTAGGFLAPAGSGSAASAGTNDPEADPANPSPSASASAAPKAYAEIASKQYSSIIWEKPNYESLQLGTLRAGTRVQRDPDPYPTIASPSARRAAGIEIMQPCGGTWYKLVPFGFVCEGKDGITNDLNDPGVTIPARYLPKDEPLPFSYGMSYSTPMYSRVPTAQEQKDAEGDVDYWRRTIAKIREKTPPEKLAPEFAMPVEDMPDFLANHGAAPQILPWMIPGNRNVKGGYALPQTRLAFVSHFEAEGRHWYLTSEQLVVPADRFKAARLSEFHGVEIAPAGEKGEHLPMVWVRMPAEKMPASVYRYEGDEQRPTKTDVVLDTQWHGEIAQTDLFIRGQKYHELLAAPPRVAPLDGVRYLVRANEVTRVDPVKAHPDKVTDDEMWIDVDLVKQTLIMYRGTTPLFVTLVSAGAGGKGRITPTGVFRVYQKHKTVRMSADEKPSETAGEEGQKAYRFDDVPWVQYVYNGIALHGVFWHNDFGQPRSHGCVNLSPRDAQYLFKKTLPEMPAGWHGVHGGRGGIPLGTVVVIHT